MIEFMGTWKEFYKGTLHGLNSNFCLFKTSGELLLKITYFVFSIFDTGERRQVLLHKLMENSFFCSKIIDHRTNKNIADDNSLEITFNLFVIQWLSVCKLSFHILPRTRCRHTPVTGWSALHTSRSPVFDILKCNKHVTNEVHLSRGALYVHYSTVHKSLLCHSRLYALGLLGHSWACLRSPVVSHCLHSVASMRR